MEWLGYAWWALIPILGIVAWAAIRITKITAEGRRGGADGATLADIRTKLDAIDARLAVVEKAINDIP